jgi:hypothetical protein
MVYSRMMQTCLKCNQSHYQVKDGFTSTGSQHMRCQACHQHYTPAAKPLSYAEDIWVHAAAARVPQAPPVPPHVETVEMDELYTFVQAKKRRLRRNHALFCGMGGHGNAHGFKRLWTLLRKHMRTPVTALRPMPISCMGRRRTLPYSIRVKRTPWRVGMPTCAII